jgi:MFS family permease
MQAGLSGDSVVIEQNVLQQNLVVPRAAAFDAEHWPLTTGLLLGITLFAFENLAIVTIAPSIAEALGGMAGYGWIFSGFLLASLLSTVLAGEEADKYGPARPLMAGLVLFGLGLLLSGFAPAMPLFIAGRVIQGFGGGALITAIYIAVNLAYQDSLRPRVVALMSTAWVIPALAGPALAGFLAEVLSWRIVFWGMVPLAVLTGILTLPSFFRLEREASQAKPAGRKLPALGLVIGSSLLLSGLLILPQILAFVMVLAGMLLSGWSLPRLTPKGTLYLKPGLPSVIAARGLFFAAFVGVEVFLALMLSNIHGLSLSVTGIAIAAGAISWTIGSWLQERLEQRSARPRSFRIRLGTSLLTLGLTLQMLALYTPVLPLLITLFSWMLAGLGIGLAHSTSTVLALSLAPKGEEGSVASALQVADQFTSAVSAGLGGAFLALATGAGLAEEHGIAYAIVLSSTLGILSIVAALRIGAAKTNA